MTRRTALLFVLLTCAGLAGCGYTQKELYPADIRTVGVPIFANRTFYQGTEFDLTEALIKEIELRTPYKTIESRSADSVLTGTIVAIEQNRLSQVRDVGLPQEIEVRYVVNFEWKNQRTGQTLRERRGFTSAARYVPTTPVSETQDAALHGAVQQMAQDIVSAMRADW